MNGGLNIWKQSYRTIAAVVARMRVRVAKAAYVWRYSLTCSSSERQYFCTLYCRSI